MEVLAVMLVLGAAPVGVMAMVGLALLPEERRSRVKQALGGASRSLAGRLGLLAVTAVVLLVPLMMVEELRQERSGRLEQVQYELRQQWGGSQQVLGPVLHVPVVERWTERVEQEVNGQRRVTVHERRADSAVFLMPDTLQARGDVSPRPLHRGLYDVLVYDGSVELEARFSRPEIAAQPGRELEVRWDQAQLVVGLSDLSAVSAVDAITWQGRSLRAESGGLSAAAPQALHASIGAFAGAEATAVVALQVRGMSDLQIGAVADQSDITVAGAWHAPSFTGFTLPEDRTVEDDAFTASWSVPGVARPVARVVRTDNTELRQLLGSYTVGVALTTPASAYASVERAMVYGFLVIGLTLMTLLVVEQALGLALHPVQWGMNGLALITFYLVLLAGSEQLGFAYAYAVASGLVVTLVGGYTLVASRSLRAGALIGGALSALYGCMWVMLRSEDQALWMGTGLVVLALVGLMTATRRMSPEATC